MDYNYSGHTSFQYQPIFSQTKFSMKQKLFGAAAMVAFILFGVSCAQQEQSQFDFDSVKQEVTITSKVTYDAGVEADASKPNGYKVVNTKPAVGRKVFIEVPYSEYKNPTAAAGASVKIFETVTDEDGMFTINIPTRSEGVDATIRLEEFTAMYTEYVKMENGKPVFKSTLWTYQTPAIPAMNINLKPGAFKFPDNNDISYAGQPIDDEEFAESVTITGNVNLAYETGFREGAFKSASNATVEFEILFAGIANPYTFGTTADANGHYSITLPMRSHSEGFTINSIKVLGIGDQKFEHWINDSVKEVVSGAYKTNNNTIRGAAMVFNDVVDGITYDLGTKNLTFEPYYNSGITSMPEPENWNPNLIGWSAGRSDLGFNEKFDKTVTLSGKIYMPYLKAYGEGDYKTERQTIVLKSNDKSFVDPVAGLVKPYGNLVVITKDDGTFSVDLPVKDEDHLTFTVELEKKDQPFDFKGSKNNVTLYEGKYGENAAHIVQIKAEGSEWYELGDFYFKYNPKAAEKPEEWKDDLIGWYRDPVFNKINPEKKIKGKFLYAVETKYGIGAYEPKPFLVTIKATQTIAGTPVNRLFVVKPDAQGNIEFDLPLKDELDQPTITVDDAHFPTNEYIHYYLDENKQVKTKKLTDPNDDEDLRGYTEYKKVYDKKNPEWNEKIGTRYYKFAQTTAVGGNYLPTTFHKNLAGWLIATTNDDIQYKESATADGQALKAVETSFLKGTFDYASKEIVAVTIATVGTVEVLTNNSGMFTFDVPLKNVGDEYNLTPVVGGYDVDDFVHYVAPGKTKTLEGHYTGDKVKEDGTDWNKIGTIYYTFEPTAAEKAALPDWDGWDTYSKYIAGWAFKKGYTFKAPVTGSVMVGYEESFRVGEYKAAENFPVKITRNGTTYVAPVDKNGDWTIQVLNEFEDDDYAVTWASPAINMEDINGKYVHFRKPNSDATMLVEGSYTVKATKNSSSAWNEKGTRYYTFTPDVDPLNWTTQLFGWDVPEANDVRLTVKGAVKKGDEAYKGSSAYEKWNAADYAFVNVTVKVNGVNHVYKVVTDGTGKFDVNVYCDKDNVPADVTLSIVPEDIRNEAFEHHDDKAKTTIRTIAGAYKTNGNVLNMDIPREADNSKVYDLTSNKKHGAPFSAKMIFDPDSDPANWGDFDWASYVNNEQDNTK